MLWHGILLAAWRSVVAFTLAVTVTWLLNKQFVAQLTYFDFTLGVTIGALVGHIPNDYKEPFWPVAIPLVVVTVLGIGVGWAAMRFERVRHLLQGEPTVLVQNGCVLENNMRRLRYNLDQLNSQLRATGVFEIEHVEFAVLEPGGQLSVLLRSQHRPVKPIDLGLATRYEGMAIELVMDGMVIHKNLREHSLTEAWLQDRLRERGVDDVAAVYYAVLNTHGHLFLDLYTDQLTRPVDVEGKHPSTPPTPSLP